MLGKTIRDIERKCANPEALLVKALDTARKNFSLKRNDKNKVYSVHSPEEECIQIVILDLEDHQTLWISRWYSTKNI